METLHSILHAVHQFAMTDEGGKLVTSLILALAGLVVRKLHLEGDNAQIVERAADLLAKGVTNPAGVLAAAELSVDDQRAKAIIGAGMDARAKGDDVTKALQRAVRAQRSSLILNAVGKPEKIVKGVQAIFKKVSGKAS